MNVLANFFLIADFVSAGVLMGIVVMATSQQHLRIDEAKQTHREEDRIAEKRKDKAEEETIICKQKALLRVR